MTLLHTMSIAGSIAVVIYLLTSFLTKRYLPTAWHKIYLTITIALFAVPFGYFKKEYTAWLNQHLGVMAWYQESEVVKNMTNFTIFVYQDGVYASSIFLYMIALASVLLGVGGLTVLIRKYNTVYLNLMKGVVRFERGEIVLNELTEKKVSVYLCAGIKTPITIGIIRRKMILPDVKWEEGRLKDVLCHELVHVKVMDNLAKVILFLVVVLNFYNPLVYYLMYRWNLTAEMYCDDRVIRQKSTQERKEYAELIIDFAEMEGNTSLPIAGLSISQKQIKERIKNMKKTGRTYGKISKIAGLLLIAVTIFTSSLTVYAYEKQQVKHCDEPYERVEDVYLYSNWEQDGRTELDLKYETYEQYINADNVIFFISETGEVYYDVHSESYQNDVYKVCDHTYESGTIAKHVKYSDGGCKMDYYDGKWCTKCGDVVWGDFIKSSIYATCPH